MPGLKAIFKKELISVMKEKTIVLAILIQLLIASFSSVILIGLMSYYDPESIGQNSALHLTAGVVGESPLSGYLRDAGIAVVQYDSTGEAQAAMSAGRIDFIAALSPAEGGIENMQLYLPASDSRSTVITMMIKDPLSKYENYLREQNGIHVQYTSLKGRQSTTYEFLYTLIVPMLMFFPAFISGSMIIDSLSEEVENKTMDTLMASPVSLNAVLFGKVGAAIFLAIIQCVMWALLLALNRLYIQNVVLVLLLALIITAFVTFGSGLISMYFKDRERSQFVYSILIMAAAGASLFFNPSPISLMARLAMGEAHVGILDVALFTLPLIVLIAVFFLASRRLLAMKA
ncbi:MAG TPA: ABC transporter permease [Methanocella sp.]|uniref:ABC transporter permease n=1 Tax=Methanocella sp. TaxID=2052833 RepID=UPI002BD79F77|nr:ABC transporter permease [Methanocella sp.]HTY92057.1 ABC transporter permease [Methanocella sp.]